jgi:hypothetical protein
MQMRSSELLVVLATYKPAYRKPPAAELQQAASELCDLYVVAPADEREEIRSKLSNAGADVMGGFARLTAEEAVRQNSPELVRRALIALSIENCKRDYRDSTVCLSQVFHSAVKLAMDVPQVFKETEAISGTAGAKLLSGWLLRDPKIQALSAFNIKEGTNAEGKFAYLSTQA